VGHVESFSFNLDVRSVVGHVFRNQFNTEIPQYPYRRSPTEYRPTLRRNFGGFESVEERSSIIARTEGTKTKVNQDGIEALVETEDSGCGAVGNVAKCLIASKEDTVSAEADIWATRDNGRGGFAVETEGVLTSATLGRRIWIFDKPTIGRFK